MSNQGTVNADHSRHDWLLVTRFAVGDAYPTEVADAQRLVDGCAECAALATDIRHISTATSQLPPVRRSRDFRISPEQAERLRGSWLERFMRGLSAPRWTVVRPLAGAAFAIGLTLAVVGALPLGTARTDVAADLGSAPMSFNTQPAVVPAPSTQAPVEVAAQPSPASQPERSEPPISAPETGAVAPLPPASPNYDATESGPPGQATVASPETTDTTTKGSGGVGTEPPDLNPPAVIESPAPVPAPSTAEALVVPSAGPTAAPVSQDHSPMPGLSATSNDRPLLIAAGLALALVALGLFIIVWLARRNYSDPLQR